MPDEAEVWFIILKDQEAGRDYLEKWEVKAAEILGVSIRGKSESERYQLLKVTDDNSEKYYNYLQDHLTFPFPATFESEVDPFGFEEHGVNCLRLDQNMQFDDFYGIFLECREGRKKVIWALANIEVDEEHSNYALIDDYQNWFWICR